MSIGNWQIIEKYTSIFFSKSSNILELYIMYDVQVNTNSDIELKYLYFVYELSHHRMSTTFSNKKGGHVSLKYTFH